MNYAHSNYLMDVIMPQVKPTTFKVIALIARKTWGWRGRESIELSYTDISTMTGISSHNTIKAAIEEAELFINRIPKDNQGFVYSMKPIPETLSNFDIVGDETLSNFDIVGDETLSNFDTVDEGTMSKFDTEPYQNLTQLPPVLKKERNKEEEAPNAYQNGDGPLDELENHFTAITGIMPGLGVFDEKWGKPLEIILSRAGDVVAAKQRITDAVDFARNGDKRYTISSPASLLTIISNMPEGGNTGETIKVRTR